MIKHTKNKKKQIKQDVVMDVLLDLLSDHLARKENEALVEETLQSLINKGAVVKTNKGLYKLSKTK